MPKVKVRSDVVRQLLVRRNISQNHLAIQAQVSQGYLSQVLQHQRHPGPLVRQRLMQALRVTDFDDLFVVDQDSAQELAA